MPATFDGNDGNDGNSANAGGAGNSSSMSAGWFFADRVNLPFVTELTGQGAPDPDVPIASLKINRKRFPDQNWSAEWFAWLVLLEFATTDLGSIDPSLDLSWPWVAWPPFIDWSGVNQGIQVQGELTKLVTAAAEERADALAEILSQSDEFVSYFLNLMTARPEAYPKTTRVLAAASLVGTFVAMYFKNRYQRPRPSQLCPALLPPIEVPGHASFPSGHSTQAHLMALCMNTVLNASTMPNTSEMMDDLWTLAGRIARNREIAGLHYPSDTDAGVAIARTVFPLLTANTQALFQEALQDAAGEWQ